MDRTPSTAAGRRRTQLLAALAIVIVAFLIPVDRSFASPGQEPPDFSRCDGLEGEERGACIWTLDRNCSFAQGEDLELCKAHACRGTPAPIAGVPVNPSDYFCREFVERRGEQLAPGEEFECVERPPLFDALVSPWWYHPIDQIEEFLEGVGLKKPVAKVVVPARPSGNLGEYHDEWFAELDQHGQCYLKDHYPRACDDTEGSAAQRYIRPEQEPGLIPDPCVAEFRSGQYDINYSVGGFVNPEDRLFGSLTNVFFGVGKGALQLSFVAVDYATGFDLVEKLGEPVQQARAAYETQVIGPIDLKDIAWLLLISYVAFLMVAGKFGVAGAELIVSIAMLGLFTVVMEGPGGPDRYMQGARDTIDRASNAVLLAGCTGPPEDPNEGVPADLQEPVRPDPNEGVPGDLQEPVRPEGDGCEQAVLRDIERQLHILFVHEPYKYINWNWTPEFQESCGTKMDFILATGPHGTVDWVRDYMRRGRAADGPCAEAATWNADATPERMVQALFAGSIAFAIAIVILAMSFTVIVAKLVIAMLFMLAPFAFAVAVLPGQGRRLAASWWTTLAQAIVVAIGMCVVLTLMLVGLRALAEAPTDNLNPRERWFIIMALVVMIWYARKRLLATARNMATSVNERLARPGAPGGGFGGGGPGLTDPRTGSIFGATRMSAAESMGLVMQGVTAAGVTGQLALKPIGAAGRSAQAVFNRRANARLSLRNLRKMERYKEFRDGLPSLPWSLKGAPRGIGASKGGSSSGGSPGGGPVGGGGGGGGGGGPFPAGGLSGGGRSTRRMPGPSDSGRRSPGGLILPGGVAKPEPRPRSGGAARPAGEGDPRPQGGGFWQRRWTRRQELDVAGRQPNQQRGWMVDRVPGWLRAGSERLQGRWNRKQSERPRLAAPRGRDWEQGWARGQVQDGWNRRQAARPANRQKGWRSARRQERQNVAMGFEGMRRDAGSRESLGERREALRDARAWRRQELKTVRGQWRGRSRPPAGLVYEPGDQVASAQQAWYGADAASGVRPSQAPRPDQRAMPGRGYRDAVRASKEDGKRWRNAEGEDAYRFNKQQTADVIAQHGFKTVLDPVAPRGARDLPASYRPAFSVEGKDFHYVEPSTSLRSTVHSVRDRFAQHGAQGVVVDLTGNKWDVQQVRSAFDAAKPAGEVWVRQGDQLFPLRSKARSGGEGVDKRVWPPEPGGPSGSGQPAPDRPAPGGAGSDGSRDPEPPSRTGPKVTDRRNPQIRRDDIADWRSRRRPSGEESGRDRPGGAGAGEPSASVGVSKDWWEATLSPEEVSSYRHPRYSWAGPYHHPADNVLGAQRPWYDPDHVPSRDEAQLREMERRIRPSREPHPAHRPRNGPRLAAEEKMARRYGSRSEVRRQSFESEDQTARLVARLGFDIERHPYIPQHHRRVQPEKAPDYRIEGKFFDNKMIRTDKASNIAKEVRRDLSRGQAQGIILDLSRTDLDVRALRSMFEERPAPGEVWVRRGADILYPLWPPP